MKNSKAIGILQAVKAGTADIFISKAAINDALDMAIAAMEQREKAFDEWCTDCKEYDHNRHCCPRYNRVIRGAVDEVKQQGWIPVSERLPKSRTYCLFTVFEHDSELEATTIETVYGCFDDYGERRYWSWEDEFGECCIEGEEQLDGDHDEIIEKVLAWRPLPKPYQEDKA